MLPYDEVHQSVFPQEGRCCNEVHLCVWTAEQALERGAATVHGGREGLPPERQGDWPIVIVPLAVICRVPTVWWLLVIVPLVVIVPTVCMTAFYCPFSGYSPFHCPFSGQSPPLVLSWNRPWSLSGKVCMNPEPWLMKQLKIIISSSLHMQLLLMNSNAAYWRLH